MIGDDPELLSLPFAPPFAHIIQYAVHVMDIYNHYRWRCNTATEKSGTKKYGGLVLYGCGAEPVLCSGASGIG